jgi:hypothetical protein
MLSHGFVVNEAITSHSPAAPAMDFSHSDALLGAPERPFHGRAARLQPTQDARSATLRRTPMTQAQRRHAAYAARRIENRLRTTGAQHAGGAARSARRATCSRTSRPSHPLPGTSRSPPPPATAPTGGRPPSRREGCRRRVAAKESAGRRAQQPWRAWAPPGWRALISRRGSFKQVQPGLRPAMRAGLADSGTKNSV